MNETTTEERYTKKSGWTDGWLERRKEAGKKEKRKKVSKNEKERTNQAGRQGGKMNISC